MRCRIERNWLTAGYDVWFFETTPDRVMIHAESIGFNWREVAPGADPGKPTFTIPGEAMEALLAEAEQVVPVSHATERHLKDAVAVRDRLLQLVEGVMSE